MRADRIGLMYFCEHRLSHRRASVAELAFDVVPFSISLLTMFCRVSYRCGSLRYFCISFCKHTIQVEMVQFANCATITSTAGFRITTHSDVAIEIHLHRSKRGASQNICSIMRMYRLFSLFHLVINATILFASGEITKYFR